MWKSANSVVPWSVSVTPNWKFQLRHIANINRLLWSNRMRLYIVYKLYTTYIRCIDIEVPNAFALCVCVFYYEKCVSYKNTLAAPITISYWFEDILSNFCDDARRRRRC